MKIKSFQAEWKTKSEFLKALDQCNKNIEGNPQNDELYIERGNTYLKGGKFNHALTDAQKSISLRASNSDGYELKAKAYGGLKKYGHAIEVCKEGLEKSRDDTSLKKLWAEARRRKAELTSASKAAKKFEIARKGSKKKKLKSENAASVSSFVRQKRQQIQLKIVEFEAQLDLVQKIGVMDDEEKVDLLFSLIDRDHDGIDAKELAAALRLQSEDLSLQESVDKAINLISIFDFDGDSKLNIIEFRDCIDSMIGELKISLVDFCEFLVMQIVCAEEKAIEPTNSMYDEKVREYQELFDVMTNERMEILFELFDQDASGELSFKEVAIGLYQLTRNVEEATKTTMNVLLMMDQDESRSISYEQFARLVMGIVAAANSTFDEVADDLTVALTKGDAIFEEDLNSLIVADAIYEKTCVNHKNKQVESIDIVIDTLSYGRLRLLFDLWDVNGDGEISQDELVGGLQQFQNAVGIMDTSKREALDLLGFDQDGNKKLDRREFSQAVAYFAKKRSIDLHTLIDFMCIASTAGDNGKRADFQDSLGRSLVGIA